MTDETDVSAYENETHMLKVLDHILNKCYYKLGFQNGRGQTYEALLTTSSIQMAQRYYDLLNRVKKEKHHFRLTKNEAGTSRFSKVCDYIFCNRK